MLVVSLWLLLTLLLSLVILLLLLMRLLVGSRNGVFEQCCGTCRYVAVVSVGMVTRVSRKVGILLGTYDGGRLVH